MHCSSCGQLQVIENARFCSGCGFLMTNLSEQQAISSQTNQAGIEPKDSPRKRGIKQGVMILLVGMLLIVPLTAVLHLFIFGESEPFLAIIAAVVSFFGGILRIVYAFMYESKFQTERMPEQNTTIGFLRTIAENIENRRKLPPQQSVPANNYVAPVAGNWLDTNELVEVGSVTENTTKLLEKVL